MESRSEFSTPFSLSPLQSLTPPPSCSAHQSLALALVLVYPPQEQRLAGLGPHPQSASDDAHGEMDEVEEETVLTANI